ncbi:MAG: MFS transporter [Limnobacter sp.]|nr:MFS transporter [Limnobacter sp.]
MLRPSLSGFGLLVALVLMLVFANVLLIAKTSGVLHEMLRQTAVSAANPLVRQIQEAYALGLYPNTFLQQGQLAQLQLGNSRFTHLAWVSTTGEIVAQSVPEPLREQADVLAAIPKALKLKKPVELEGKGEVNHVLLPVLNTFDQPIGALKLSYKATDLNSLKDSLIQKSRMVLGGLCLAGVLILLVMPAMRAPGQNSQLWHLTLISTLGMLVMAASLFEDMDQAAKPILTERVRSLAQAEQNLWNKAIEQGFGQADFSDLTVRIEQLLAQNTELQTVRKLAADGALNAAQLLPATSDLQSSPVNLDGGAQLLFVPNPEFLSTLKLNLLLDYLTLAVVMFFFFAQFKGPGQSSEVPLSGKPAITLSNTPLTAPGADRLKPALFLFFLSEEFLRPFLPNYAAVLDPVWLPALSGAWVGSLSISIFMIVVALSQPVLNRIHTEVQAFNLMMWGCGLTALAQGLTGLAPNAELLFLGRGLAGVGYACAFVAAQSVLLMRFGPERRTLAFASLVAAIMAATVVGPAFGGLLADNFGTPAAVAMAVLSPLAAALLLVPQRQQAIGTHDEKMAKVKMNTDEVNSEEVNNSSPREASKNASFLPGLSNPKLLSLSLFAAVPAKMMLTGLLFYLLPKTLAEVSESSASVSGRLILLYGLLMLILAPWLAKRWQAKANAEKHAREDVGKNAGKNTATLVASRSVSLGLLISASLGLLPLLVLAGVFELFQLDRSSTWTWLALGVALTLGFGQASSISSQGSLVQIYQSRFAPQLSPFAWLGTYRLIERFGNAMGPLVVAWLLTWLNAEQVLVIFGACAAVCAGLSYCTLRMKE